MGLVDVCVDLVWLKFGHVFGDLPCAEGPRDEHKLVFRVVSKRSSISRPGNSLISSGEEAHAVERSLGRLWTILGNSLGDTLGIHDLRDAKFRCAGLKGQWGEHATMSGTNVLTMPGQGGYPLTLPSTVSPTLYTVVACDDFLDELAIFARQEAKAMH